ncbi:MAG: endonuclease/exonuclease/phosphatase family protein [Planctomycetaceae bacterium]
MGAAFGTDFQGATQVSGRPSSDGATIRVATFNIHSAVGIDGTRSLDRVADCLRGCDFVSLNEVCGTSSGAVIDDHAARLGRSLDLGWRFFPFERTWGRDDFGNGVLSRLPIDAWHQIPLAYAADKGYRNAALVTLRIGNRRLNVLSTHIAKQSDRESQMRSVSALFLALAEPAILLGDLNSWDRDPLIMDLKNAPGVKEVVSATGIDELTFRADWIFFRGLTCRRAGLIKSDTHRASDHPMLWADLALPDAASRPDQSPLAESTVAAQ